MDPVLFTYTLALAAACVISLALGWAAFRRAPDPGAMVFAIGNLAPIFYCLGTIIEIHSTSTAMVTTALSIEYLGIATVGPFWFFTVWFAQGHIRPFTPATIIALFAIPVLIILAVFTNPLHHLFYASITMATQGPFTVPLLGKGPLYIFNLIHMNLFLIFGSIAAVSRLLKSPRAHRRQYQILVIGSLFPWFGMLWYQSGLSPWGLDMAPIGMALSGVAFGIALFKYRIFDLSPLVVERVFESMQAGVLVIDLEDRLVGLNPAMEDLVPGLTQASIGTSTHVLAREHPWFQNLVASDAASPHSSEATIDLSLPGQRRVCQVSRSPLQDHRGRFRAWLHLFYDITPRVILSEQLAELARTDSLTGLANRRQFHERAALNHSLARRENRPWSLIMIDLDHFKAVNDLHGHDTGDAALVHCARIIRAHIRDTDLALRWGGEELLILLEGAREDHAVLMAERIRQAILNGTFAHGGVIIPLSASFGAAGSDAHPDLAPESLLQLADQAMYEAKRQGRNRVCRAC